MSSDVTTKPWYQSRTLWLNAIVLMLAAAEAQLGVLKDVLPGGLFAWVAFGLPVANAALRLISTTAITSTSASSSTSKGSP
jgi:hypothetical protein